MRSRWQAYIVAPLIVVAGSCTEGVGLDPTREEVVLAFCASEMPVWFAYQNEGESWTRVQPSNNAFTFDAARKVAIAMAFDFGASRLTDVYYTHIDELRPLSNKACTETTGTRSITGSVAGLGATDTARISMSGGSTKAYAIQTGWTLADLASGPQDVVAHREQVTLSNTLIPNRVIVRRAQNPVSGSSLATLDFNATEALAVATNTLTISGLSSAESNYYDIDFMTATGTSHLLYQSPFFTSASQTLYGVPATLTQAGDLHRLDLNADASSNSYRTVRQWYRNSVDKSVVFGGALTTPSVQNVASTPYSRMRTTLAAQTDYPDFVTAYFIQNSNARRVYVTVTAAHLGGTPATWTNEIPDFSAAGGYPSNAGLVSGASTNWFVEAFDGALENYISATPSDGAVVRFAGRGSTTTAAIQMSLANQRQSPRASLDRRAFRQ